MARTRTGSFPIGFRRGWSDWQKNLANVIAFATGNGFEGVDVDDLPADQIKPILAAGLVVGSVDMKRPWSAIASADAGMRKDAVAAAAEHIKSVAALGVGNFFTVVFPDDDSRDRRENFRLAVDGYSRLAESVFPSGARIVMEGYPGSYPYYPALCCTPESLRAFFREAPHECLVINYDPSHLIRMGIDPVRFLREFAARIGHVHAKDTLIMEESLYEFGNLQPATLAEPHRFGGYHWRYAIPGHGQAPWATILRILRETNYRGVISIELEDEDYNDTEAGEKRGLLEARDFLVGV
ncbi:MAG: sugar phosphate isomerase/epimerase [Tepidisphaeraceae bacterium]